MTSKGVSLPLVFLLWFPRVQCVNSTLHHPSMWHNVEAATSQLTLCLPLISDHRILRRQICNAASFSPAQCAYPRQASSLRKQGNGGMSYKLQTSKHSTTHIPLLLLPSAIHRVKKLSPNPTIICQLFCSGEERLVQQLACLQNAVIATEADSYYSSLSSPEQQAISGRVWLTLLVKKCFHYVFQVVCLYEHCILTVLALLYCKVVHNIWCYTNPI